MQCRDEKALVAAYGEPNPRRCFNRREIAVIRAICARLFRGAMAEVPQDRLDHFLACLNAYVSSLDLLLLFAMKAMLLGFQMLPILFVGSPMRFTSLGAAKQDAYLEKWEKSGIFFIAISFVALKTFFSMVYYENPKVLEEIGFDGKCMIE